MSAAQPVIGSGLRPSRAMALLLAVFAAGVGIGAVGPDRIAGLATDAFKAIAGAHYRLYTARENLGSDGEAEYAVLPAAEKREALEAFVNRQPGWAVRDALVPGWAVVSVPPDSPDALARLRGLDSARAVLRNRGMWICH